MSPSINAQDEYQGEIFHFHIAVETDADFKLTHCGFGSNT